MSSGSSACCRSRTQWTVLLVQPSSSCSRDIPTTRRSSVSRGRLGAGHSWNVMLELYVRLEPAIRPLLGGCWSTWRGRSSLEERPLILVLAPPRGVVSPTRLRHELFGQSPAWFSAKILQTHVQYRITFVGKSLGSSPELQLVRSFDSGASRILPVIIQLATVRACMVPCKWYRHLHDPPG